MAQQTIREWRRGARAAMYGYPEAKVLAKDATNSDEWGPTTLQKSQLADLALDNAEDRAVILRALFKRLDDTSGYWMHVQKALDCLEHLLLSRVPGIERELEGQTFKMTELTRYCYAVDEVDTVREGHNASVRVKAQRLLALLRDHEQLSTARERLRRTQDRLDGKAVVADPPTTTTSSQQRLSAAGVGVAAVPVRTSSFNDNNRRQSEELGYGADPGLVNELVDMGFTDIDRVVQALMASDNTLERAVQFLVENPTDATSTTVDAAPRGAVTTGGTAGVTLSSSTTKVGGIHSAPLMDIFETPSTTFDPPPQQRGGVTAQKVDLFAQMPSGGGALPTTIATTAAPVVVHHPPAFDPFAQLDAPTMKETPTGMPSSNVNCVDFFAPPQQPTQAKATNMMMQSTAWQPPPLVAQPPPPPPQQQRQQPLTQFDPFAAEGAAPTAMPATAMQQKDVRHMTPEERLMAEFHNKGPMRTHPGGATLDDILRKKTTT